jgi:hypothetical protein
MFVKWYNARGSCSSHSVHILKTGSCRRAVSCFRPFDEDRRLDNIFNIAVTRAREFGSSGERHLPVLNVRGELYHLLRRIRRIKSALGGFDWPSHGQCRAAQTARLRPNRLHRGPNSRRTSSWETIRPARTSSRALTMAFASFDVTGSSSVGCCQRSSVRWITRQVLQKIAGRRKVHRRESGQSNRATSHGSLLKHPLQPTKADYIYRVA